MNAHAHRWDDEIDAEVSGARMSIQVRTCSSRIGISHRTQARHIPDDSIESMLLLWLLHHPFQRTLDIALALHVSYAAAHRHISRLEDRALIEAVTPALDATSKSRWFYLNNAGVLAAAAQEHTDAKMMARSWGADEQGLLALLPRFHWLADLQSMVNSLMEYVPSVFAEAGGHMAEIAWVWVRDYQRQFIFHKREAACSADAAVAFQRRTSEEASPEQPDSYYCFFLFIDAGPTPFFDRDLILQKLLNLLRYRECEERIAHRVFPTILVVVQSPRQLALWQQCCKDVALSLSIRASLSGAIVCLPRTQAGEKQRKNEGRMTHSAWTLNWRDLSTNAPVRLRELLRPMGGDDLPPGIRTRRVLARTEQPVYKHVIVRGKFEERRKQLDLAPGALAKERGIIALLGLSFSRRYRDIFLMIYANPFLSTTELSLVLSQPRSAVQHYLEMLQRWQFVQVVSRPGQEWRWVLTDRGLRFLAAAYRVSLLHVMVPAKQRPNMEADGIVLGQRGAYMLYKYLQHTSGVYHYLALLHKAAQENGHRILWWEAANRCERRYRSRGTWHNFRPDAIVEYEAGEQRLLAWIEWDRGTMNGKNIRSKLESYKMYITSGEWTRIRVQKLPLLLVIVPGKSQHDLIAGIAREVLGVLQMLVRITTIHRLERFGPLSAIWTHVLPKNGREEDRRQLLDLRVEREEDQGAK